MSDSQNQSSIKNLSSPSNCHSLALTEQVANLRMFRIWAKLLAWIFAASTILSGTNFAIADAEKKVAGAVLDFGINTGRIVWNSAQMQVAANQVSGGHYQDLAKRVQQQIEFGRVSSSVVVTTFNIISASTEYAASLDPELMSRGAATLAAFGAKKVGDELGGFLLGQAREQARAILATGLKNSGFTQDQLKSMSPKDLAQKVGDLRIGRQKLKDILKDDPDSLQMITDSGVDIATEIGVAALAQSKGTAADVKEIRAELSHQKKSIDEFQHVVGDRLDSISKEVAAVNEATLAVSSELNNLSAAVSGNVQAVQALSEISYSGWSTSQKIQAVRSGLFPALDSTQRETLVKSLEAEKRREETVNDLRQASQSFGDLAAIAKNIGLPADAVKGLQSAQALATGIAQFATGNYLGAVTSVTSLAGLSAPDAGASRHAALMSYLDDKFREVNRKLDQIIDLQVKTLDAIASLAQEQQSFRRDVLGQMDRIESAVINNDKISQAILINDWRKCDAFINGTALNKQYSIDKLSTLLAIVRDPNINDYTSDCYSQMASFLDAYVVSSNWTGQIIDAGRFPTAVIQADPNIGKAWRIFADERTKAYSSAKDFVRALAESWSMPALELVRFAQPVMSVRDSRLLSSDLSRTENINKFRDFTCDQDSVLTRGLRDLICVGLVRGSKSKPLDASWKDLLDAALIGPHALGIINSGIVLATVSNFAKRNGAKDFEFAKATDIENISKGTLSAFLTDAVAERKGALLLEKLSWLAEASVMQQGILYGNYTAELIERTLYDPVSRALKSDPTKFTPVEMKAHLAMRANPLLARNVVMLAMRHSISDNVGGDTKAEALLYRRTLYQLALDEYSAANACDKPVLRQRLEDLFPNWKFEYRATSAQRQTPDKTYAACEEETGDTLPDGTHVPRMGAGVAISLGNFYVLAPSTAVLQEGIFVQTDSLKGSLRNRDRLSQAMIDQNFKDIVSEMASKKPSPDAFLDSVAYGLLSEGWGWRHRPKAMNHTP